MAVRKVARKLVDDRSLSHIEFAIPPEGNPAIYQWQKYWGRKPHNVVRQFIDEYCPENGIVLDPFVGSGVTAIEAIRSGRRALVCDLNPMSADIIYATINPPDLDHFKSISNKIIKKVQSKIQKLYEHTCRNCGEDTILLATSLIVKSNKKAEPLEFRYKCSCKEELIREKFTSSNYFTRFNNLLESEDLWWPDQELSYPNGEPFKERQKYTSYHELFSPRNLLALAYIWDAIESSDWENSKDKRILEILFRSIVHLCSRVSGDRKVRPLSTGWTQHSYWFAKNPLEINVLGAFQRKLHEYEAVIENWKSYRKTPVKIGRTPDEVLNGKADIFFSTQDCATFLRSVSESKTKADYVFTDPPYNGLIQYGELSFMWNAWRSDIESKKYLSNIEQSELTENKSQNKKLPDYYQHLRAAFSQISDAVKPGSYIHVTYCSPKVKYRNLTLRSARLAGLEFEKLHFQQSVRVSKKAIEQPFGSVFGDFIFRFVKPSKAKINQVKVTKTFDDIVEERTVYMLKHRCEPTPINVVIAECERELYNLGFFDDDSVLQANVEKVIKLKKRFRIDNDEIVHFSKASEYEGTPLSLRIEKTVRELLTANRVVTYTDVWSFVLREYPNSLTPDSASISTSLKKFASPKKDGIWEAKASVMRGKSTIHNKIILSCGRAFKKNNHKLLVGKPEKSDGIYNEIRKNILTVDDLIKDCNFQKLSKQDKKRISNIDLVAWDHGKIEVVSSIKNVYCLEVETTTNFIDAFERVAPLLRNKEVNIYFVLLIGSRIDELKSKIENKLTFKSIDDELKKKAKIISFDVAKYESFEKLSFLIKKINEAPTWYEIEKKLG